MICPEASNVICYDLHTINYSPPLSGCRNLHSEYKATYIFNNFLVIWEKVALDADIVHRLTQNTRNTVLLDTEYLKIVSRNSYLVNGQMV